MHKGASETQGRRATLSYMKSTLVSTLRRIASLTAGLALLGRRNHLIPNSGSMALLRRHMDHGVVVRRDVGNLAARDLALLPLIWVTSLAPGLVAAILLFSRQTVRS